MYYVPVGEVKLSVGEYISLVGEFEKVNVNGNFWEFDFNSYLLNKNVKYKISNVIILKRNFKFINYYFYKIVNTSNNLSKLFIFQQKTSDSVYKNLNNYSLTYLINLSGLNVYLIANFFNKKIFKNSKRYKKYKIIPIILYFLYSYLLGFKLFILKSCILLIINWIELNWNFRLSKFTKLSIIWIVCLFINPLFVFNIGFVFSIIAVLFIKKYKDKKPMTNLIYNFLIINSIFIPLQVFYDYKFFWFSSIFEILLVPFISFCFILSFLFIIPFCNPILEFVYKILYLYTKSFSYINLTTIVGSFSVLWLISYFIILKVILSLQINKKSIRNFLIVILSFNSFLIVEFNQLLNLNSTIVMLNVGNANSFLLQYKGKNILFDAGSGVGFNKTSFESYLIYKGIRKIDAAFISHNHKDHYDQLESIERTYNIKEIFWNTDNKRTYVIKDLKITNFIETSNKDENDNSQVSLIEVKNRKILFTGDATKKREYSLINDPIFESKVKGGIDFLQVGHHGSKTSTSESFIKLIKPKTCFISGHKKNNLNFPSKETIDTLNKYSCKTYVTNGRNSYKYNIRTSKVKRIQKNSF
ncbi:ComEC/Rec2 family competence protein [Spiroplasma diminutum]|uniref:ComEC/Rec2 family competence protein n=1 Tax=Spiroplasma diminutum TaxID=216936 RepID=UPI00130DA1AD|nr:ComEC/Rec2 family competence protein [Spiroplasma diminutum]